MGLTKYGFPLTTFTPSALPDYGRDYIEAADLEAFERALCAPESSPIIALNDWRPVHQRVKRKSSRKSRRNGTTRRTKDETREGFVYGLLKWPLLLFILAWIIGLSLAYLVTRTYIWAYERFVTWRGRRQVLRNVLRSKTNYEDWKVAAQSLDSHLGNNEWKAEDSYAYYDHSTVRQVTDQLRAGRLIAESEASEATKNEAARRLGALVEACVKDNFVGVENPRLYSETYYGTKNLAQEYVDELDNSLAFLLQSSQLSKHDKYSLAKHMHTNYGRTALCLSGGASFAWYHFGVVKALLDASLLPDVVTGTSGGALVAAFLATHTDEELRKMLVPALAFHITACEDSLFTWLKHWWRTGARFDSVKWAEKCSWFCRGSTTFKEAYERTGRILNVTCVPSDPHSPTILTNYLTAPDCVIWSAVLASAAVPGILNPVVMMAKNQDGSLSPYSFGHKWKDGSLRTDIPLKALNLHFGVTFSIVSQVNPHVNAFFYASKGTVGRPVTHRKGRGWRGGYLGSATETYLKLEMQKFLKMLRHLELLPRPLGQDWSGLWLQQFSGTITIWPKSRVSDFYYILSDPNPDRLARMLQAGQHSVFPKLLFIQNRMKIERRLNEGLLLGGPSQGKDAEAEDGDDENEEEYGAGLTRPAVAAHLHDLVTRRRVERRMQADQADNHDDNNDNDPGADERSLQGKKRKGSREGSPRQHTDEEDDRAGPPLSPLSQRKMEQRRSASMLQELKRQSGVFFDDLGTEGEEVTGEESDEDGR